MKHRTLILLTALLITFHAGPSDAARGDAAAVESLRQTGKAFASVAQKVSPSVVSLQVEGTRQAPMTPFGPDEFFRRFFGDEVPLPPMPRGEQRIFGQGSGFAFRRDDGKTYIMTNNHVVQNAERISVRLPDGREFDGKVTGTDPQSDVAVIEIETTDVPILPLGTSSELEVGEWVVAIGSPFGLRSTLTVGVVSATGRTSIGITDYEDFIQTDAAINPGNSGGPLVNLDGEVVGMNTAIFSQSGGYMGIGFAIPADLAKNIATQLIEGGTVTRGFIGVLIQPLTQDLAESFGIDRTQGVLVAQVSEGSPAAKAGIEVGDVIVRYRGEPVSDAGDFRNRVAMTKPGTEVRLTVLRDGKQRQLDVTIGSRAEAEEAGQVGQTGTARDIGLAVQEMTPEMAERLGLEPGQGVVVSQVAPNSPAARVGITPGSVILQVNQRPVGSVAEFNQAIAASKQNRAVMLVRSGNAQQYVVLSW
ncbi:MAG TPA: DegQ family serine endoprotease [Pseudomonadales bacterium]